MSWDASELIISGGWGERCCAGPVVRLYGLIETGVGTYSGSWVSALVSACVDRVDSIGIAMAVASLERSMSMWTRVLRVVVALVVVAAWASVPTASGAQSARGTIAELEVVSEATGTLTLRWIPPVASPNDGQVLSLNPPIGLWWARDFWVGGGLGWRRVVGGVNRPGLVCLGVWAGGAGVVWGCRRWVCVGASVPGCAV